MLKDLFHSPIVRVATLTVAAYWAAVAIFPLPLVAHVLNVARLILAVAVIFAYAPSAWEAIRSRHPSSAQMLLMGIVMAWLMHVAISTWSTIGRAVGEPTRMVESSLTSSIVAGFVLAAGLHLTAPTVAKPKLTVNRSLIRTGIIVGGILAAAISILPHVLP